MKKTIRFSFRTKGFTLIELLVVIAIIGLLSSIVLASLSTARAKARDAQRLSDLTQIRNALALYYSTNGSYPLPGNGMYWGGVNAGPSCASINGTVSGATAYISGLVPTYIPVLPVDPSPPAPDCRGYLYHSDGKDYMFLIYYTVEGAVPPASLQRPIEPGQKIYAIWSGPNAAGW